MRTPKRTNHAIHVFFVIFIYAIHFLYQGFIRALSCLFYLKIEFKYMHVM